MTEDILMRVKGEFLKKMRRKMGDVYTLLCLRSAELIKAFDLKNLCYYKISLVMLLRAKT